MESNRELVQYYLVNQDLGMGKGKVAAQVAHAATIYAFRMMTEQTTFGDHRDFEKREELKHFIEWYHNIQTKIILKAPQELLERYEKHGYLAIRDKGYTQIAPNSLTVVCIGVMPREDVSDEIKELSLL